MTSAGAVDREAALRRGRGLEWLTLAWNSVEAVVAFAAGVLSGSIALVGFGLYSVIENTSAVALLWRLSVANESSPEQRERAERLSLRAIGVLFLLLAAYVAGDSAWMLWQREVAERSLVGIALTGLSIVAMFWLARAKRRVAAELGSGAMLADSRQTDFCRYLSSITLCGLVLNAWLGWWWADPVAALAATPIIAREGFLSLRGKACGCGHECHGRDSAPAA